MNRVQREGNNTPKLKNALVTKISCVGALSENYSRCLPQKNERQVQNSNCLQKTIGRLTNDRR